MAGQHTPGPWSVTDNRSLNGAYWIEFDFACSIAEVRHGGEDTWEGDPYPGTPEANARLIAAAPDLLDEIGLGMADLRFAAQQLAKAGLHEAAARMDQREERHRAAIAKARGTA